MIPTRYEQTAEPGDEYFPLVIRRPDSSILQVVNAPLKQESPSGCIWAYMRSLVEGTREEAEIRFSLHTPELRQSLILAWLQMSHSHSAERRWFDVVRIDPKSIICAVPMADFYDVPIVLTGRKQPDSLGRFHIKGKGATGAYLWKTVAAPEQLRAWLYGKGL